MFLVAVGKLTLAMSAQVCVCECVSVCVFLVAVGKLALAMSAQVCVCVRA